AVPIGNLVADGLLTPLRDQTREVGGRLAGDGEGLVAQTAVFPVHADELVLPGGAHGFPGTLSRREAERPENCVRLQHPLLHLLGGIETERLGLPQREQTGNTVDIGIGQQEGLNRGAAGSVVGKEAGERVDWLADIRSSVDQVPALPIAAAGYR